MNEPWLKDKWNEYRGRIQEQWGERTDDDLDRVDGQRKQLEGKIQQRYGKSREEAEQDLDRGEQAHDLR